MKRAKEFNWMLAVILIAATAVCFLFSYRKTGMHIDEVYTYGLSNSYYAPYPEDIKGGTLDDQVFTRQEIMDYLTVNGDEGFDVGSVYYNQGFDVHPPLYYWLFNAVFSLFPGLFSKWPALALNYVIYMLALILLYRLVYRLFGSRYNALAAVVLYSLSLLGLSTMLMLRMYVLVTMLTLLLDCLVARIIDRPAWYLYPLVGVTILAGLMTQYYFVFYAFLLCAAYVFYALIKKRYRSCLAFSLCAVAGALCLLIVYPSCLRQLFADQIVSGGSALDNLRDTSQYYTRLRFFFIEARHGLKAAIFVTLAAAAALAVMFRRLRERVRSGDIRFDSLVIILPAFVCFVIVSLISPVLEQRYIYNLIPLFVVAVSFLLYLLEKCAGELRRAGTVKAIALALMLGVALWQVKAAPPQYLFPEQESYDEALEEYSSLPCVYVTDGYHAPLVQDLRQLLLFDDFITVNDLDSDALHAYIGQSGQAVVFIDVDGFWSSGYDAGEVLGTLGRSTGMEESKLLYAYGLTNTYLISD